MKKIAFSILIAMGLHATTSVAADQTGLYFGVTGGQATSNALDKGFTYSATTKKDPSDSGIKVFAGLSSGIWGIELGHYDFGKFGIAGTAAGLPASDEYGVKAFAISAAAAFPLDRNVALTTKLGLASATASYRCLTNCAGISDTSTESAAPIFGIGLKWRVTDNLGFRVDWETIGGIKSRFGVYEENIRASLVSAGIQANF